MNEPSQATGKAISLSELAKAQQSSRVSNESPGKYSSDAFPVGETSPEVRVALNKALKNVPITMRRSLTWDQGSEINDWEKIETDLELDIYICSPHSPWERPTNERANRQLRYWLPKRTDLKVHSQKQLNHIAHILNTQPRRIHNWNTSQEIYNQLTDAMTV